ncbi:DMT family transporter [Leuconostoc miyukkimchii]|mgnify:CR=1 FL=1|uniref:DMT family transporter n=1 Tax=Leuconostoc miyukkimchii TaxID=910540 RepID=UPI001C7DAD29|nr:DMT family transporter [Leuconostoc miyukkimchii]
MNKQKYALGLVFCIIAVLSWGGMFPVMKPALKIVDPFYFTLFRYGAVAIIFAILLLIFEGKKSFSTENNLLKIWILGSFAFAGFSFLVFLGQKLAAESGAMIASVMMAIQPLLALLLNWFRKGIKPNKVSFFSMIIAAIGVVLVMTKGKPSSLFQGGSDMLLATILILLGALCWVIYTSGSSGFPNWSILRYSTLTTIYGMLTVIVILFIATIFGWLQIPSVENISSISGALTYMITLAGVIAVFSWNMGSRLIKPLNAILFMNLVPITAFSISVWNGYKINSFEMMGCFLTILALVINNLYIRKNR